MQVAWGKEGVKAAFKDFTFTNVGRWAKFLRPQTI